MDANKCVMMQNKTLGRVGMKSQAKLGLQQPTRVWANRNNSSSVNIARSVARQLRTTKHELRVSTKVLASSQNQVTVSDTKKLFLELYPTPIAALYNTILQELLVQHHLICFGSKFAYDKIYALGFVSVYDGILKDFPGDSDALFSAYLKSLQEEPEKYREDAASLTEFASSVGGVDDLLPNASGSGFQQEFAQYASGFSEKNKVYNKFFAIGMFRMLELASATEPASLEKLVSSMGIPLAKVTSDLGTYKGLLSKLTKSRELMVEMLEEQRKRQAQREEEKRISAEGISTDSADIASA